MKRRQEKRSTSILKKRYNLCHRLRLWGVGVDTENYAIEMSSVEDYEALRKTPRRYVETLRGDFGYVVQYVIPMSTEERPGQDRSDRVAPAVRFRRAGKNLIS